MARRSRWEHLKDEIIQHCKDGLSPRELYPMYPDVPPKTIRNWYEMVTPRIRPEFAQNSPDTKTIAPQDVQVMPLESGKLIALDGGDRLSDFATCRNALRDAIRNPTKPGAAIKIQASFGLMKLTQMRYELPKHILDEVEMTGVEEERDRIREKTPAELAREYKDLIDGNDVG